MIGKKKKRKIEEGIKMSTHYIYRSEIKKKVWLTWNIFGLGVSMCEIAISWFFEAVFVIKVGTSLR